MTGTRSLRRGPGAPGRSWPRVVAAGALLVLPEVAAGGTLEVEAVEVPVRSRAVGTVRPRTETRVMAQASGRILAVHVREGQHVSAEEELVRIEDRELVLRLDQARRGAEGARAGKRQAEEALRAAESALELARSEHRRIAGFLEQDAATPQQMDQARAALEQAEARVAQARHGVEQADAEVSRATSGVEEVGVLLAYARVVAPVSGRVAERMVEPGDLAWPGRPLLRIQDPDELQLEALVREALTGRVRAGQAVAVEIDALGARFEGRVLEIVPVSDPVTRKFTVKVVLPRDPRLVPGMFGRLEIPRGTRPAVLVPESAVRRVGQLQLVEVMEAGVRLRRLVRTGERFDGRVEVLAGLRPGEVLVVPSGEAMP